jgi:hypothetical protein
MKTLQQSWHNLPGIWTSAKLLSGKSRLVGGFFFVASRITSNSDWGDKTIIRVIFCSFPRYSRY